MQRSTVKWFDAKKGYGFIDHPEDGDDVFVHYSQIISEKDFKTLRTGQEVAFDLNDGPKGLHALEVKPIEEHGEATTQDEAATQEPEEAAPQEESGADASVSVAAEQTSAAPSADEPSEPAQAEQQQEEEWEDDWDEEEWTDEHGNPPDPLAGPSF